MLLEPLDVEEVAPLKRHGCCAYYASRNGVKDAHLVAPYASLHAGTRSALGVSLKRSVVIIDEAHNLVDTIMRRTP